MKQHLRLEIAILYSGVGFRFSKCGIIHVHVRRKFMLLENVGNILSKDMNDVMNYLLEAPISHKQTTFSD